MCLLKSISYGGIVLILCVGRERKPPIYVNIWRLWFHRRTRKECLENWGNRQSNSANANDKMNSREYLLAMAWHEHSIVVLRFFSFCLIVIRWCHTIIFTSARKKIAAASWCEAICAVLCWTAAYSCLWWRQLSSFQRIVEMSKILICLTPNKWSSHLQSWANAQKKIQGQTVASVKEENKISTFSDDTDETDGGVWQKTPLVLTVCLQYRYKVTYDEAERFRQ